MTSVYLAYLLLGFFAVIGCGVIGYAVWATDALKEFLVILLVSLAIGCVSTWALYTAIEYSNTCHSQQCPLHRTGVSHAEQQGEGQ